MLFSSFIFLFGFLPATLVLTFGAHRYSRTAAKVVLTLLSLVFYAWWRPIHLPLLLWSILFNFVVGGVIQRADATGRDNVVRRWLVIGLMVDLLMLGWFKYANFVADNISALFGAHSELPHIVLPLAISFFTFQKIAYLINSSRGDVKKIGFIDFSLFAAFFPQLISGPIVHYSEVVPQLQTRRFGRLVWRNILVGLVILSIGLFKKTVIADTMASYVDPLFSMVAAGQKTNIVASWLAGITYTFQLYFDFSGYSDMAIGLGIMFGVRLPLNFHSPLRSASIIDYWRRWHMTLQRFIFAYIFQPLSLHMSRAAASRDLDGWSGFFVGTGIPVIITFIAVGAWHGAGWTFIIFGVLQGIYVCVNEGWRQGWAQIHRKRRKAGKSVPAPTIAERIFHHVITLVAVVYANVLFRADSVRSAFSLWDGMTGFSGFEIAAPGLGWGLIGSIAICSAIIFLMPNTQQIMRRFNPACNWREWRDVAPPPISWTWSPSPLGLIFAGVTLFLGVIFIERGQAVFLYFNF